jgi:hypothetical protein
VTKWNATLPRAMPDAGMSQIVFAYKTGSGSRMELTGQIAQAEAEDIMKLIIEKSKRPVEQNKVGQDSKPEINKGPWLCLFCKSSKRDVHGTLDDGITPCPNKYTKSKS